jgi:hypothetical protein
MTLVVVGLLPVLILGFVAGWAARQGENARHIERRARRMARQMTAPVSSRVLPDDVIDAEIVYAASARMDRPEVEA